MASKIILKICYISSLKYLGCKKVAGFWKAENLREESKEEFIKAKSLSSAECLFGLSFILKTLKVAIENLNKAIAPLSLWKRLYF